MDRLVVVVVAAEGLLRFCSGSVAATSGSRVKVGFWSSQGQLSDRGLLNRIGSSGSVKLDVEEEVETILYMCIVMA